MDIEPEDPVALLTQGIARLMDINCPPDKIDKYIKHIQTLCFGPIDDKFSKYFGLELSPDECLDCLLNVDAVLDHCLSNYVDGCNLAYLLIRSSKLSDVSGQFLSSLLPHLISHISMHEMKPTILSLWKHSDKSKFPVPLVECMLLEREELEGVMIQLYFESVENSVDWDNPSLRYWVQWSSQSPFIFQSVTTVLNNILIHSNNRLVASKMVSEFIESIEKECIHHHRDIVFLYPLECQSVVSLLRINPNNYKSDLSYDDFERLTIKSMKSLLSDPHVYLMLLSQFTKWLPMFSNVSVPIDIG